MRTVDARALASLFWGTSGNLRLDVCGLSFLALIVLGGRLFATDRELAFLRAVLQHWLPSPDNPPKPDPAAVVPGTQVRVAPSEPARVLLHVAGLRQELQAYILELSAAKMTLILSVVFVVIFILSWWWMAFAVRQAKEDGSVSLRTVLLLAVFAAVDVAASAGFILLRIIMYARRDHLYPRDLRTPALATEHDQLASYAAMRLVTLQSSCGSTDVLVIVVVGFLTCLRVYSVACVFSFYKKAKDSPPDFYHHQTQDSDLSSKERIPNGGREDFVPRPLFSGQTAGVSKRQSSELSGAEPELRVQAADMPAELQKAALQSTTQALRLYSTEKLIAECIKQDFDLAFGPTWHCIVGRHWGSCVTHSKQCYIRISCRDLTILLYKST